jgi:hypothetical protein
MIKYLLTILLFLSSFIGVSQIQIKGIISDKALKDGIANVSVVAIRTSDSSIVNFTRTIEKGIFMLNIADTGSYNLLYTHPAYADFSESIYLSASSISIDNKSIELYSRAKMIKEVIIRGSGSIRLKGDTMVYVADSFKVSQDANVEELLKQLPGIEVDKDGVIKAQGQTVQKVLVDGDEFFGEDPTVATQNLEAKIIDKVEVFDKKSDQAELTGFDDGEKTKTINLKMKKGMNKGLFGKLEASSDFNQRWNNKLMVNQFEGKRKLAGFGVMGSTYDVNLNWSDARKYGSDQIQMDTDNGYMYSYSYDDGSDGGSSREGLPNLWQGSLSYSNKWRDDKLSANGTAALKQKSIIRQNESITNTVYGSDTIRHDELSKIKANRLQPSGSARLEWKPDTNITIRANVAISKDILEKNIYATSQNILNSTINTSSSERNTDVKSTKENVSADVIVVKKMKKKGRSISLQQSYSNNQSKGENKLLATNTLNSTSVNQDQLTTMKSKASTLYSKAVYTEPLLKNEILMELNYSYQYKPTLQDLNTFTKNQLQYDLKVDSLSNNFNSAISTQRGGIKLRFQQKKYTISGGLDVGYTKFLQENTSNNIQYNYARTNLFPNFNMNYKLKSNSSLSVRYSGYTQQPTLNQLQPLTDVSNQLSIVKGNPNLKQEYNQSISFNYWDYKMITERNVWLGGYVSHVINNINNVYYYDETFGRNINTYQNLNGVFSGSCWGGIGRKISKRWKATLQTDLSMNRNPFVLNDITKIQKSYSISLNPEIEYYLEDKFSFNFDMDVGNNLNKLDDNQWNTFWTLDPSVTLKYVPIKRLKLKTDITYSYQEKTPPFNTAFNRITWNAFTSYDINKKRTIQATLTVNDILNQNNGYSRYFSGNILTESNNLTIRRYWLVGLVWKFNKSKIQKKDDDDDDEFF